MGMQIEVMDGVAHNTPASHVKIETAALGGEQMGGQLPFATVGAFAGLAVSLVKFLVRALLTVVAGSGKVPIELKT